TVSSGTAPTGATTFDTVNPPVNSTRVFVAVTATDTVASVTGNGLAGVNTTGSHTWLPSGATGVSSVRVQDDPNVIPVTGTAGPATLAVQVPSCGSATPSTHE